MRELTDSEQNEVRALLTNDVSAMALSLRLTIPISRLKEMFNSSTEASQ